MRCLRWVLIAITLVAGISLNQAATIPYDQVEPFPETEATTDEYKLALEFKPRLAIRRGCHPYPAVNADGDISEGLKAKILDEDACKGSSLGSQVYGRSSMYKDKMTIMYAWYFPRVGGLRHSWEHAIIWLDSDNTTISAVTTSRSSIFSPYVTYEPPGSGMLDGSSVKLRYFALASGHSVKSTDKFGDFQDLVMWEDMTDAARDTLSTTDFGWGWRRTHEVPFIDKHFTSNLDKANPW